MRDKSKKMLMIVTLTVSALLVELIMLSDFIFKEDRFQSLLYEIRFFCWGWGLVFVLAGSALTAILYWKVGHLLLRGFLCIFLTVELVLALVWLWFVWLISNLPT
jgi:hypothetical protein